MTMILRPTKGTDFEVFQPSLDDLKEAQAAGIKPAFPDASKCVTLSLDGFPLAIGGHEGDQCWFVTSDQVWRLNRTMKLRFRRLICDYRDQMLSKYDSLWNYVWIGNTNHIRFLKVIGAVFHPVYTRGGQFQLFTITK